MYLRPLKNTQVKLHSIESFLGNRCAWFKSLKTCKKAEAAENSSSCAQRGRSITEDST